MALYYGVFDKEEEPVAFNKLMEFISANNNNFDCGFLGMHVLFHVLSAFGQSDLAYEMITKKKYPSYAYLIEQGETTLVESIQPQGKLFGSHNHHFLGDIGGWFMSCIAGINVINSIEVEIRPNFLEKLEYASAYYDLPTGRVSVFWKRCNDGIKLKVDCNSTIKYSIILPDGYTLCEGIVKETCKQNQ